MKIGIVNDVALAAEALRRAVALAPEHETIWIARDGIEAVELCARQTPDLVLMDLIMPGIDGVEATRRIMKATPCAILVVTASVDDHANMVFEAMGHGALDAVDTPAFGSTDFRASANALLNKIKTIVRLVGGGRQRVPVFPRPRGESPPASDTALVAIGASAGGPAALATLLAGLPPDFPAAVAIVQHVDHRFARGMATWLNDHSTLPVRLARDDDPMAPGVVLLAGTEDHLILKSAGSVGYTSDPGDQIYRPSVDVFFESVSERWRGRAVGVLLTGMGADGAAGLKLLRQKGHHTIAQDQSTSAVYGMPKSAAAMNAAVDILPLPRIAARLQAVLVSERRRARAAQ